MKNILVLSLVLLLTSVSLAACKEQKILHCDYCGGEILVNADNQMEEHWVIYCEPCNKELFTGHPLLDPN